MEKPLHIFCCYARVDQPYLLELRTHLIPFQRTGLITIYADVDVTPGENWKLKIYQSLDTAHIILLLISPAFLASEYCSSNEMMHALKRHNEGNAQVIPIILRPCYWENMPFSTIQALPTNVHPIAKWLNRDDAFLDVTNGIRKVIEKLLIPTATIGYFPSPAIGTTPQQVTVAKQAQPARSRHLSDLTNAEKAELAEIDRAIANEKQVENKQHWLRAKIRFMEKLQCWDDVIALYDQAIANEKQVENKQHWLRAKIRFMEKHRS